MQVTSNYTKPA